MTDDQMKAVLDRVLTWPRQRQEDAALLLESMESQDASLYRLTDDQVREIERRRSDITDETRTLDEFNQRFGQFYRT